MPVRAPLRLVASVIAVIAALSIAAPLAVAAPADAESAIVQIFFEDGPQRLVGDGGTIDGFYHLLDSETAHEGRPVTLTATRPNGSIITFPDAVVDGLGDFRSVLAAGTFDTAGPWRVTATVEAFAEFPRAQYVLHVTVSGQIDPQEPEPVAPTGEGEGDCPECDDERDPVEVDPIDVKLSGKGPKSVKFSAKCVKKGVGCPAFTGVLAPAASGLPVKLVLEKQVGKKWKSAGAIAVKTTASGAVKALWKPAKPKAATKIRARWEFAGDDLRFDAVSSWMSVSLKR